MSIDLEKKSQIISTILLDKGIHSAPVMRVGIALDISGSMDSIIRNGDLQKAFNQMMGVSVKFDDNGELDVFKFHNRCEYVGTSKPVDGDFDRFINANRISAFGGTSYAPIVDSAMEFFLKPKKKGFLGMGGSAPADNTPVLMLILTDGEPNDKMETLRAMKATSNHPIYFHLVGVGGSRRNFPTIAYLADELPNVGEVYLPSFDMPDADVYQQLICDELVEFAKGFSPQAQAATV